MNFIKSLDDLTFSKWFKNCWKCFPLVWMQKKHCAVKNSWYPAKPHACLASSSQRRQSNTKACAGCWPSFNKTLPFGWLQRYKQACDPAIAEATIPVSSYTPIWAVRESKSRFTSPIKWAGPPSCVSHMVCSAANNTPSTCSANSSACIPRIQSGCHHVYQRTL